MALPSTRLEYRIALSNVDRSVEVEHGLIVAQHPSETLEHVTLRVLAWCLLHEERLEQGPGLSDPDAADLWTRDLTGRLTTWVECGGIDDEKLRKIVHHNSGAAVHVVLGDERRRAALLEALEGWKKPPRSELTVWSVAPALVAGLAAREGRRHRWTVTVVGGHVYIDADGVALDGAVDAWTMG